MSDRNIGIKLANGQFYPILEDGKPARKRLVVTTVKDDQPSVQIDMYRGSGETAASASYIGRPGHREHPAPAQGRAGHTAGTGPGRRGGTCRLRPGGSLRREPEPAGFPAGPLGGGEVRDPGLRVRGGEPRGSLHGRSFRISAAPSSRFRDGQPRIRGPSGLEETCSMEAPAEDARRRRGILRRPVHGISPWTNRLLRRAGGSPRYGRQSLRRAGNGRKDLGPRPMPDSPDRSPGERSGSS
ncbi:MAG: hypothetical protein M0C28_25790 [Candidatus Moduliflexus flocculans]|nr:hypothetical protein [Candidatus Moduliflexus flocculans]